MHEVIKPPKKKAWLENIRKTKFPPNLQKGDPGTERNQIGIIF
jgi:hypothetical protein